MKCVECDQPLSEIKQSARYFKWIVRLIECPACFGWWEGLTIGIAIVIWTPPEIVAILTPLRPFWLLPLYLGLSVAGSNFVLGRLTGLLPSKYQSEVLIEYKPVTIAPLIHKPETKE